MSELRIDQDLANVLRVFQPDSLKTLATVQRLVHTVAISNASLTVVLARSNPNHVVVPCIHHDAADRVGTISVKDGSPRIAGIGGLPHAARRRRDIPCRPLHWIDRNVNNPARHERRSDPAKLECGNRRPTDLGDGIGLRRVRLGWFPILAQ